MSRSDWHITKILVVDDNDRVREAMCSRIRLSSESYWVEGVGTGREALDRLDAEELDIVLCDLVLPGGGDGIATTREICEKHPQVRVVVFSGAESGDRKVQVLKTGAFSFLSKPINYEELLHAIRTINRIRQTERLGQSFKILATMSHELQMSFDFDYLTRRIVRGARELGFARARLYLYDKEHQILVGKASVGMDSDDEFEGYEVPMDDHPMLGELFQTDRPMIWNHRRIVERYGEGTAWMSELALHGITWIDLPLLVGNERIGTIAVDNGPDQAGSHGASGEFRQEEPDPCYSEEDLEILEVYAGMAAQALNNAEMYEKETLANASLGSILRDAPDGVVTTDLKGDFTFVSPSAERLIGHPAGKLVGQPSYRFYTDPDLTPDSGLRIGRELMERLRSEGTFENLRVDLLTASGQPRPASMSMSLLHDERGEAIGTLGIVKDLGVFEGQSEQYRDVLEGFGYGTLLLGPRGNIQYINRKAQRLLLTSREKAVGRPLSEMVLPAQRGELEAGCRRVTEANEEVALDLSLLRADASRLAVSARLTPVRSPQGLTGVAVAFYDKGELGALIQSGRLMALGQMVAGMAHEINNPLNNMLVAARELENRLRRDELLTEKNRRYMEMVDRNGQRIQDIVRTLRDFARPSTFEKTLLDLNQVIDDALGFFRTRFRNHNIELAAELAAELPRILGDANRLQQVLVNLIVNAEDAMEGQAEPKTLEITSRRGGDDAVEIVVSDSGCGIPEEIVDAIFDPFFTTKAPNKGTGLGLSITKSIMDLHDAEIHAARREGRGTRLTLRFRRPQKGVDP